MQRDIGLPLEVAGQHRAKVQAREHVTVEHHGGPVAQLGRHVGDTATGTPGLLLHHVLDLEAQLGTVAEFLLEHLRLVRGAQHHVADARGGDPREQVGQERHTSGRQHRLGRREGQRAQPGALPTHQDDRVDVNRIHRVTQLASFHHD